MGTPSDGRRRARILVVDDERAIRRFLHTALTAHGYDIAEAASGEKALEAVVDYRPDLVILDLGLPDTDGIEVIRSLREWTQLPIVVLSVRDHESDKIAALDGGADDYLTKPFGTGELLARLRASLRRAVQHGDEPGFAVGCLSVDLAHRRVKVAGDEVLLTPTEYDILRVMAVSAGKVITHRQLLNAVWGDGYEDAAHLLRVNISNLRHKLEPNPTHPQYILTEPGIGYRLRAEM